MPRFVFPLPARLIPALLLLAVAAQPAANPKRPQTPQPPFPYLNRDVSFVSSAGQVKLEGTLTLPGSDLRAPCVILVPGAGAVERDNTIMGHKPFLVMADYLARRGIATLRLDSRGAGRSTGSHELATGADLADDLLSAVDFLRNQPGIDPRALGLLGHSQGGTVAALAAGRSPGVRFLILLAAPALPDTELFAVRIAAEGIRKGLASEVIGRMQEAFRRARVRMLRGESDPETVDAIAEVVRLMLPTGVDLPAAALAAAVEKEMAASRAPNRSFFLSHDPRPSLGRVACPVLALNGTRDQNVPAGESLAALKEAFGRGGNPDASVMGVQGVNHFFQTAVTGSSLEIGQIEETISPKVLELISGWILGHTAGQPLSSQ